MEEEEEEHSSRTNGVHASAASADDEDDPRYCAVLESRTRKRMDSRTDIVNPKAYRATILGDLLPDADRTRALLARFPDAPAEAIAGHLDGEPSTLGRYRSQQATA